MELQKVWTESDENEEVAPAAYRWDRSDSFVCSIIMELLNCHWPLADSKIHFSHFVMLFSYPSPLFIMV